MLHYPEKEDIEFDDRYGEYTKAFSINQLLEIKLFFKEYGFVIVKDVLSIDECLQTENELMKLLNMDINKSHTLDKWPYIGKENEGLISRKPIFSPNILNNRQNKNIYLLFSELLKEKDLTASHDTVYFIRPTKLVKVNNTIIKNNDKWKIKEYLRLDCDPTKDTNIIKDKNETNINEINNLNYSNDYNFIYENLINNDKININGLINIKTSREYDGGFVCVPKFHKYYNNWLNINKNFFVKNIGNINRKHCYIFNKDDKINDLAVKINVPIGSIILWDSRIPYKIENNKSKNYWIGQKIRLRKKINNSSRKTFVKNQIKQYIKFFNLNEIGKKVFF